jgi:hypothetical protein
MFVIKSEYLEKISFLVVKFLTKIIYTVRRFFFRENSIQFGNYYSRVPQSGCVQLNLSDIISLLGGHFKFRFKLNYYFYN